MTHLLGLPSPHGSSGGNCLSGSQQCSVSLWNILSSSLPLSVLGIDTCSGFRMCSPVLWQSFSQNVGSSSPPLDCGLDSDVLLVGRTCWCDSVWFPRLRCKRSPGVCLSPSVCLPQPSSLLRSLTLGEASCHVVRALKQPSA